MIVRLNCVGHDLLRYWRVVPCAVPNLLITIPNGIHCNLKEAAISCSQLYLTLSKPRSRLEVFNLLFVLISISISDISSNSSIVWVVQRDCSNPRDHLLSRYILDASRCLLWTKKYTDLSSLYDCHALYYSKNFMFETIEKNGIKVLRSYE